MNKSELETLQRRLELELNQTQAKRENIEFGLELLRREVGRINDRVDELSSELIFVIDRLRKF